MVTKNKDTKKEKQMIYLIGIILIVFIVILAIFSTGKNKQDKEQNVLKEANGIVNIEVDDITIAKLQNMEERDRMEYYFNMFLEYLDSGNYESAYDLLYSEFKENYFPTLQSFEEYVKKVFPEMASIEHENIERNGDVYVLWIKITDVMNGKKTDEPKEMNIVIRENDYNDFEMSFSVI